MAHILALHAHPDDIEILAGGTLAILAAKGHAITIVTATAGEGGSAVHDPAETGRIRQAEAGDAAALIDASYRCLGFADLGVFNDDPSRRAVTELIRSTAPDLVITASPVDYHPDHEAISLLARDACFAAPVANYSTGPSRALSHIPALYFTDSIGGRDRDGVRIPRHFAVNVATTFAIKQSMLAQHESQADWVARQHGIIDHLADMDAWTRRVGRDYDVDYAEGFRQYRHPPYPKAPVLQDLLSGLVLKAPA